MTGNEFVEHFTKFASAAKIDTKEYGVIPFRFNKPQEYIRDQIAAGIDEGIRDFTILKCRQIGCSTEFLALDNFWISVHQGMQGAVVTDTDDNKKFFRSALTLMSHSMPKQQRRRVRAHNGSFLLLDNRSRLFYLTAGTRKKGDLGRAKGVNYLHSTECSSWADQEGLDSLKSALAQLNPNRLYLWESTARGFNIFYDMWETAKKAKSQKAIFVTWWLHDLYRVGRDTALFRIYGQDLPTKNELEWIREVKSLYGYDIEPEQLAWWRWMLEEEYHGDETSIMQEHPPTENHAFVLTGNRYFSSQNLTESYKLSMSRPYDPYRYNYGVNFYDIDLNPSGEWNSELKIWEYPKDNGVYVIGADSAFGGSEKADANSASVYRCYADRCVQVAAFRSSIVTTRQFAWVIAHLGGAYSGKWNQCWLLLEMNGPGQAVKNELDALQSMRTLVPATIANQERRFRNVIPNMNHFVGTSAFSVTGGARTWGWKTTADSKPALMALFKSNFESGVFMVNDIEALKEMRFITQDGKRIEAEGSAKDDRAISSALANWNWYTRLLPELKKRMMYYESEKKKDTTQKDGVAPNKVCTIVSRYLNGKIVLVEEDGTRTKNPVQGRDTGMD